MNDQASDCGLRATVVLNRGSQGRRSTVDCVRRWGCLRGCVRRSPIEAELKLSSSPIEVKEEARFDCGVGCELAKCSCRSNFTLSP